ncbi:MAG: hypothetical protein E6X99_23085 [Pantoea sp.]|nr:hypothetical protein [Pantoea sp.]
MSLFNQLIGSVQAASAIISSSLARDVVRITDAEGNSLFQNARVMRATVREESTLFEHPLEDGNKVADQKIIKPVAIQFAAIMTGDAYGATYNALRNAYHKSTPLIVQTKTGSYANQYLESMPHEETPEAGDSIAIALTFREVQFFKPDVQSLPATEVAPSAKSRTDAAGTKVVSKQDASTVNRGQVRGTEATAAQKKTVLASMADAAGKFSF